MTAKITRTSAGGRLAFNVDFQPPEGRWYLIALSGPALRSNPNSSLVADEDISGATAARFFIPIRLRHRTLAQVLLVYVPFGQRSMAIEVGKDRGLDVKLRMIAVPQAAAAMALICLRPSILLPSGKVLLRRGHNSFRKRLALAAIRLGPRMSYLTWQQRYDSWETAAVSDAPSLRVTALVFADFERDRNALEATLASLDAAGDAMPGAVIMPAIIDSLPESCGDRLRAALHGAGNFLIVLQAGEVISAYAISAAIRFAGINQFAIVYADEDKIDFAGKRSAPVFKPEPSRMMMLSGSLATGMFLIRRDALGPIAENAARCADAFRLDAWLHLDDCAIAVGATPLTGRLPMILTHRRPDTAETPAEVLADIARSHLGPSWIGEIDATQLPLRIRPGVVAAPKVSLIVASTGRLPHVRECLSAVLAQTKYPDFEMIIVLSQNPPLDAVQTDMLAPIVADARVRVVFAPMQRFNYSSANNVAASHSKAPLICLLNDDVTPITPDWLAIMVGHLQDQRVAAVGAKLYYPEGTVQHAGVIIGLCGLADHSFRFLPRAEAGYAGRASIEQELSAVTAACMLIRKPVFDAVGGLDEIFASAFNDVDLCLKIRAAGHRIVWSAQAELWHHETITFGKHYADEDKPLADRDIRIMRERWAAECAVDPFHNPNLSLEVMSEWELAFPPRLGELPAALGLVAAA